MAVHFQNYLEKFFMTNGMIHKINAINGKLLVRENHNKRIQN